MQITGKLRQIGSTETFGSNGFKKREVVVTTEEQYPQHIMVEFVQDKTELLNNFSLDQSVIVSINLRGREWVNPQGETKYFNSIQGWRIESAQQANQAYTQAAVNIPVHDAQTEELDEDIPF